MSRPTRYELAEQMQRWSNPAWSRRVRSTPTLALLLGFWLVAYGLTLVISSFLLRSQTSCVRAVLFPRHT